MTTPHEPGAAQPESDRRDAGADLLRILHARAEDQRTDVQRLLVRALEAKYGTPDDPPSGER